MAFATTRWSVVRAAGSGSTSDARAALQTLCSTYWYPLYAFARRSGRDTHGAQDSVQGFFVHLLEKGALAVADESRGRFRSFLLAAFRNHMANEHRQATAEKRGGGRTAIPLDGTDGEGRLAAEAGHQATPERLFERDWATTLLDRVLAGLRADYDAKGQRALFDALKDSLAGDATASHATKADLLGMTEGAFKVAVHRLRTRYRHALRGEVAETLADGESVDEEIRALFAALGPV